MDNHSKWIKALYDIRWFAVYSICLIFYTLAWIYIIGENREYKGWLIAKVSEAVTRSEYSALLEHDVSTLEAVAYNSDKISYLYDRVTELENNQNCIGGE